MTVRRPALRSDADDPFRARPVLFSVGHGTIGADDLVALLHDAGIGLVIDVRSFPGSRRHPHFAREALEGSLPAGGIGYRWDRRLGGFRKPRPDSPNVGLRHPSFRGYADHMESPEFAAALAAVLDDVAAGPAAVMCSESLWWRCHRRLLADAATLLGGAEVLHLGHDGRLSPHRLTDGVRLAGPDRIVYDAGQERLGDASEWADGSPGRGDAPEPPG